MKSKPKRSSAPASTGVNVELPHYGSDSPGYCGKVVLALNGNSVVYSREDYSGPRPKPGKKLPWIHQTGALPVTLPKLTKVESFSEELHSKLLRDNFSEQDLLCYLDEHQNLLVEADRIKVLEFEDGSPGIFMIHGESCYFTLVAVGHIRVEVEAYGDPDEELVFKQF